MKLQYLHSGDIHARREAHSLGKDSRYPSIYPVLQRHPVVFVSQNLEVPLIIRSSKMDPNPVLGLLGLQCLISLSCASAR